MRTDRSFAFLDLCGFTAFTDVNGDDEAVHVLGLFRKVVREVASDYAVRIDKWLGDGVMLVSVEPSPLVEAVLEIERRCDQLGLPLPLRGGVTRGDVILMDGDDYIGGAVNMAARLCALAEPHAVLTVHEIAETAWPSAKFVADGVRLISGFAEPVAVFDIVDRSREADHSRAEA
jgi:class 3 adenylate cyclase